MGAVSAHSTIITSVSDPAFAGSFVEDFSSTPLGNYTSLQLNTLTITAPGDVVRVENEYSGQYNTQGNYLDNDAGSASELVFTFGTGQKVFGFNYGALDDSWTFSAYNSSNQLIDSTLVQPDQASNAGEFIGIESASPNIAYATFTQTGTAYADDYILLDNLHYSVVPEPSAYAPFILCAAVLFVAFRRSRKAQAVPVAFGNPGNK
jgi:hypothetical protein